MKESTLKNHRILIKNIEDGKIIADTKIIRFDSLTNSVTISADSLAERKFYRISAFVFAEECLYEFFGTIKGAMVDNEIEVFLGKSKTKEDRAKTRYSVALEGNIDGVLIDGRLIRLRKVMNIRTINMSANGILMKADAGCFHIGDCFSMSFQTEERLIEVTCEVVRIQNSCMLTEEYGCRITEIRLDQEIGQENER
ncbi:MAG: PilZ domain-containing protein [Lachnospiraceae bacterium]|nr:PilZ domain-containing protein [Lachnospiraceae bacterium]